MKSEPNNTFWTLEKTTWCQKSVTSLRKHPTMREKKKPERVKWPARNPDLNLKERLWKELKLAVK